MRIRTISAIVISISFLGPVRGQIPGLVNYHGRITAGGKEFAGTGQFKFALLDSAGAKTYWSNDGSSIGGSEPLSAVLLNVEGGQYSVMLGDTTISHMTVPIPATVFGNSDVRLRVWFNDGKSSFRQVAPDQSVRAVAFSLFAASAVGTRSNVRNTDHRAPRETPSPVAAGSTTVTTDRPSRARPARESLGTSDNFHDWVSGGMLDTPERIRSLSGRLHAVPAPRMDLSHALPLDPCIRAEITGTPTFAVNSPSCPPSLGLETDGVPVWTLKTVKGGDSSPGAGGLSLEILSPANDNPNLYMTAGVPFVGIGLDDPGLPLDVTGDAFLNLSARFRGNVIVYNNVDVGGTVWSDTLSTDTLVSRTASTETLTITGGADVAEPFLVATQNMPSGTVVVIDDENAGYVKQSERAYDRRVAGVVSGGNGISPGLTLSQKGVLEQGRNVTLGGRVYALADVSNGAITPGDLLTTSSVPGHAMRVTDTGKAQGATIGKAMSSLDKGEGMVLVLVSLQ